MACRCRGAHPRVGGENYPWIFAPAITPGSSPRGRGKLKALGCDGQGHRLIPAWAGKTLKHAQIASWTPAHPRVGGENLTDVSFPT